MLVISWLLKFLSTFRKEGSTHILIWLLTTEHSALRELTNLMNMCFLWSWVRKCVFHCQLRHDNITCKQLPWGIKHRDLDNQEDNCNHLVSTHSEPVLSRLRSTISSVPHWVIQPGSFCYTASVLQMSSLRKSGVLDMTIDLVNGRLVFKNYICLFQLD